jgi:transposase
VEPIHQEAAVNQTTKSEDKHMNTDKYVGLDVHKVATQVVIADEGRTGEVRHYGKVSSDLHAMERLVAKLGGAGVTLHFAYEAGPTGFVLYRWCRRHGLDCIVVAPTRIPQAKGVRQKTNRRDAAQLARALRAGELEGIHVPDELDEAFRDLTRARSDASRDLKRVKQRLKSFLLRQGYHYSGHANWTEAHRRYLRELVMPSPVLKAVLEENLLALEAAEERLQRLEELVTAEAPKWRWYPAVQALMCCRGFGLIAAALLVAELNDVRRFAHPRGLMAYLGLIPREHSTGDDRRLGAITKAGNAQARWILVEAIQHASLPPKVSAPLAQRQAGQPEVYRRIGWKMQHRLYKRHWHLTNRRLMPAKVKVALARELCGFVWDLLRQVPPPAEPKAEVKAPVSRSATRPQKPKKPATALVG